MGLGLVYRSGATTGGVDIVAKVLRQELPGHQLRHYHHAAQRRIIVRAYGLMFRKWDAVMYTIIAQFVVSRAIDTVLYGLNTSKVCYLISESKSEELEHDDNRDHAPRGYAAARRGRIYRRRAARCSCA